MKTINESFADGITYFRRKQKLSVAEVENACGVSHGYIARVRNRTRTPSLEIVMQFARFFGVGIDELLNGGTDDVLLRYIPVIRCYECKFGHQTVLGDRESRYCEVLRQATHKHFYCGRGELK